MKFKHKNIRKSTDKPFQFDRVIYQEKDSFKTLHSFESMLQSDKSINEEKLQNFCNRLLTKTFRRFPKPILVIYLTPDTMRQVAVNDNIFTKRIAQNVGNKYYTLILPTLTSDGVKAELWYKGNKARNKVEKIYENNIWMFHDIFKL